MKTPPKWNRTCYHLLTYVLALGECVHQNSHVLRRDGTSRLEKDPNLEHRSFKFLSHISMLSLKTRVAKNKLVQSIWWLISIPKAALRIVVLSSECSSRDKSGAFGVAHVQSLMCSCEVPSVQFFQLFSRSRSTSEMTIIMMMVVVVVVVEILSSW